MGLLDRTLGRRRHPLAPGRVRWFVAPESRDADEETELAFHRVWLARELRTLPKPRRRPVTIPPDAAGGVAESIDGLRSRCGLTPLPRRRTA